MRKRRKKTLNYRRALRKNQTDAERKLWSILRNRRLEGIKFRRQYPFDKYIIDFYSPEFHLAVEVDGGQHYDDDGQRYDEERTKELSQYGIRVLRFSNMDVLKNSEGIYRVVLEQIDSFS